MRSHIDRAKANERFLAFINDHAGDEFIEWKITVLFYTSLHYIKALLIFKDKPSGRGQRDIDRIIDPSHEKAIFPFPAEIYDLYITLYQNAWESRYLGVYENLLEAAMLKQRYLESQDCLIALKKYLESVGLQL